MAVTIQAEIIHNALGPNINIAAIPLGSRLKKTAHIILGVDSFLCICGDIDNNSLLSISLTNAYSLLVPPKPTY